jgi:hypothetical protein
MLRLAAYLHRVKEIPSLEKLTGKKSAKRYAGNARDFMRQFAATYRGGSVIKAKAANHG